MKKKIIAASMIAALSVTSVAPAVAATTEPISISSRVGNTIPIIVNGLEIACDQPPVIIEGRTLVPLRAIFEVLGAEVYWNNDTRSVTATRGDTTILLTIGSSILYRNGETIYMDVPGQIINDRTMVPLRAVSESFGSSVYWDNDTRTVHIYTDTYNEPEEPSEPENPSIDEPEINEPTDPVAPVPPEDDPSVKPEDPEITPPEEEQPPVVDDQAAAYNSAMDLYKNGYSHQAYYAFRDLGNYQDSVEMMEKAKLLNRISYNYTDYTSKWFVSHVNDFVPISESEIPSIMTQGSWLCPYSQCLGYSTEIFLGNGTRLHDGLPPMEWHVAFGGIYASKFDPNTNYYTEYSLILQKDFRKLTDDVYANIAIKVSEPIKSGASADIYIQKGSTFGNAFEACTERRISYMYAGSVIGVRQDETGMSYLVPFDPNTGIAFGEKLPS